MPPSTRTAARLNMFNGLGDKILGELFVPVVEVVDVLVVKEQVPRLAGSGDVLRSGTDPPLGQQGVNPRLQRRQIAPVPAVARGRGRAAEEEQARQPSQQQVEGVSHRRILVGRRLGPR